MSSTDWRGRRRYLGEDDKIFACRLQGPRRIRRRIAPAHDEAKAAEEDPPCNAANDLRCSNALFATAPPPRGHPGCQDRSRVHRRLLSTIGRYRLGSHRRRSGERSPSAVVMAMIQRSSASHHVSRPHSEPRATSSRCMPISSARTPTIRHRALAIFTTTAPGDANGGHASRSSRDATAGSSVDSTGPVLGLLSSASGPRRHPAEPWDTNALPTGSRAGREELGRALKSLDGRRCSARSNLAIDRHGVSRAVSEHASPTDDIRLVARP